MRFLENFRNRPSNFSCVLGTLKGVQNAPEHHHNTSISISNLQKRILGPFVLLSPAPAGLGVPVYCAAPPNRGVPRAQPTYVDGSVQRQPRGRPTGAVAARPESPPARAKTDPARVSRVACALINPGQQVNPATHFPC